MKTSSEERVAHTPTPFVVDMGLIRARNGVVVAGVYSLPDDKEEDANAAFIVTACNAHEALVDALRALTDFIEKNPKKQAILSFPYKQARAVLSQAGAK